MANSEWVDNGNAMTVPQLNGMINNRASAIHRIDEDIERLEQAIRDIDHAIACFRRSVQDMQLLEAEVALVFKGESAESFLRKLQAFRSYCSKRIQHMETLRSNYTRQIASLRNQKAIAQALVNLLLELLSKLRRTNT